MKRLLMILVVLFGFTAGVEAKTKISGEENVYYFDVTTTKVLDEKKVNSEIAERNAINQALKDVPDENKVIMPSYFYNEKQLETKGLMIDTDTFEGVWIVNTDSGEFTEVKGFPKDFLKEELAEGTFDGIEFKMVWSKLYVNIDNLKAKGILKEKEEKKPVFKKY